MDCGKGHCHVDTQAGISRCMCPLGHAGRYCHPGMYQLLYVYLCVRNLCSTYSFLCFHPPEGFLSRLLLIHIFSLLTGQSSICPDHVGAFSITYDTAVYIKFR